MRIKIKLRDNRANVDRGLVWTGLGHQARRGTEFGGNVVVNRCSKGIR